MRINSLVRFVALLAVVALAVPALAKPVSKTINISQPAKLGSSQLTAGEYRLLIDGTKVNSEVQQARGRSGGSLGAARERTLQFRPSRGQRRTEGGALRGRERSEERRV